MIMDDIAEEILLRLPVRSLGRCRLLSKDWQEFICRNPSFRKRFIQRNEQVPSPSFMLGLYLTKQRGLEFTDEQVHFLPSYNRGRRITVFSKRKTDNNGHRSDKALKKKRDNNGRCGDKPLKKKRRLDPASFLQLKKSPNFFVDPAVRVLGSSNGFLLCSLDAECPLNYIIINPINKLCVSLPVASISSYYYSHGFICRSKSPQLDTIDYYKVVRGIGPENWHRSPIKLEIISSDSNQWSLFNVRGSSPFQLDYTTPSKIIISESGLIYVPGFVFRKGASARGDNSVIIFDQSKEKHVHPIKQFPPSENDWYCKDRFGESEGSILYARRELGKLKIWKMDDHNGGGGWTLICNVSLESWLQTYPDLLKCPHDLDFLFLEKTFHPTNKNAIFFATGKKILVFDMNKSKVKLVCHLDNQGCDGTYYFFPYICGPIGPHLFFCD